MARIVIIQHELETLGTSGFSLQLLIDRWRADGHSVCDVSGIAALPDADVAILHVNVSLVPSYYAEAASRYPVVVNSAALDIRKRLVSRHIIDRDSGWDGPVIVKTDDNCGSVPEWVEWKRRGLAGLVQSEEPKLLLKYRMYRHSSLVPEETWSDSHLVVERFLPERDEHGFYLRTWIFFGDQERCRRFSSKKAVIKGSDYLAFQDVGVPQHLREERSRLGFDYGKFDFVMHRGEAVLLDVNKTPGIPPAKRPLLRRAYSELAGGLTSFLKSA